MGTVKNSDSTLPDDSSTDNFTLPNPDAANAGLCFPSDTSHNSAASDEVGLPDLHPAENAPMSATNATLSDPLGILNLHVLKEQLFDTNVLRLWRTGANEELYQSVEDNGNDVSYAYITSLLNSYCYCSYPTFVKMMEITHSVRMLMLLYGKITEPTIICNL